MKSLSEGIEEVQKLFEVGTQYWLLGAGASVESNIPLMYPLTARVKTCLQPPIADFFEKIVGDLPDNCHVEHVLSHLGDLIAIAERSKSKEVRFGQDAICLDDLKKTYKCIVTEIATTVRYGYRAARGGQAEEIGTLSAPIVDVTHHRRFVRQLFRRRTNLESRSRISFITTNYDTLLEDALTLERRIPVDGFAGAAIAFWTGDDIESVDVYPTRTHRVLKLHGSVDWFKDDELGLLRVRYGVRYLSDLANTLIYPQATKYVETQKDPFARIFDCFRKSLAIKDSHILAIVGYSFGDEHINGEIEHALSDRNNKTNIIAFSKEMEDVDGGTKLAPALERWRTNQSFGSRVYIASDKALYCGTNKMAGEEGKELNWWTFSGLTDFLEQGAAA